jgi:1,3-beta-glucanosyltransferase GAS3
MKRLVRFLHSMLPSSFSDQTQGYNLLVDMFDASAIPVLFSEYGCNKPKGVPRVFNEVQALYGGNMTALSGGLVYEYSQEESDYGLVIVNENSTVTLRKDFDNLQLQYNKLDLTLIQNADAAETNTMFPECSQGLISTASGFSKNFTVPERVSGIEDLINNGIKNPTNGKLIKIEATTVPMAVYGSNGNQIKDLAIKPLADDQTNIPGGEITSGDGPTPSGTPKKKGSAAKSSATGGLFIGVALAVLALV